MFAQYLSLLFTIFVVTSSNEDGMSGLYPPTGHHDDHDHSHHDHDHSTIHKSSSSSSSSSFSLNSKATFPVTAVLMTLASGSTAVVGGLLVVYFGVMSDRVLGHMLSFAAGVMLYISYGDILMHSIEDLDAAMSTAGASHDHHHHHHEDEEDGHGHTHGPGLFYANAFLFFGMAIYIFISLALKTLSGEGEGGHGHSHMNLGSTAVTASKESDNDDIIINSSSKRDKKTSAATNGGLKQRRTSTATISEKSATTTTTAVEKRIVADVAGGEEGSFSSSESSKSALSAKLMRQGLMWTGLNAALGIAAHNLPEGLVVYNHTIGGICERNSASKDLAWWEFPPDPTVCLTRGVAMTFAIALHNIPEGMAVAAPIFAATESKWEAMKWCILSSLGEPIAAVLFGLFFSTGLTKFAMAAVNATTAGIMIALCLAELMPTAASLAGAQSAVISNVVGQLLMFGSIHFMRTSGVH